MRRKSSHRAPLHGRAHDADGDAVLDMGAATTDLGDAGGCDGSGRCGGRSITDRGTTRPEAIWSFFVPTHSSHAMHAHLRAELPTSVPISARATSSPLLLGVRFPLAARHLNTSQPNYPSTPQSKTTHQRHGLRCRLSAHHGAHPLVRVSVTNSDQQAEIGDAEGGTDGTGGGSR